MITSGEIVAHGPSEGQVYGRPYVPGFLVVRDGSQFWSVGRKEGEFAEVDGHSVLRLISAGRAYGQDPSPRQDEWKLGRWVCVEPDGRLAFFEAKDEMAFRLKRAKLLFEEATASRADGKRDPNESLALLTLSGRMAEFDLPKIVEDLTSAKVGDESLTETYERIKK